MINPISKKHSVNYVNECHLVNRIEKSNITEIDSKIKEIQALLRILVATFLT